MSLLNILNYPNASLDAECDEVSDDEFGDSLDSYMSSMLQTMYARNGVGLAAPQVGILKRFLVADMSEGRRQSSVKMVNPKIVSSSEKLFSFREGCLSLPDMSVKVERPWEVSVQYQNPFGEYFTEKLSGYYSIVIQHEIDHLNGKTILSHSSRMVRDRYLKKYRKNHKKKMRLLKKYLKSEIK